MIICTNRTVFIRSANIACCASLTVCVCVCISVLCTYTVDRDCDRDHCYCHFCCVVCCVLNARKLCSKLAFVSLANFVESLEMIKKSSKATQIGELLKRPDFRWWIMTGSLRNFWTYSGFIALKTGLVKITQLTKKTALNVTKVKAKRNKNKTNW